MRSLGNSVMSLHQSMRSLYNYICYFVDIEDVGYEALLIHGPRVFFVGNA